MKPLWITYAWTDNEEGNFDHFVAEIEKAGIPTKYDRVALVPGRRLWDEIDKNIRSDDLSGWACLVTPNSLASEPCREELAYALNQALKVKGGTFPILGLLGPGVDIKGLPQALSTRLCVDLRSPNWLEQVRAAVEQRPPQATPTESAPYIVQFHQGFLNDPALQAIEVRPRLGEVHYWRIAFPVSTPGFVAHGTGPANGKQMRGSGRDVLDGTIQIGGVDCKFVGSGDSITPATSGFAVFRGNLPDQCFVGSAAGPSELPQQWLCFPRR
ncbi:MAG: toll/interleukin-1 receptor domain-containing protein [Deltaproteobacteria bacterium]|nr:toll/interleukin-1 receptor domain-containing protein [Deltaproteobacteria bacterium]